MTTDPAPESDAPRFATRRLLSDCVHCGLCLEACPTYRELGQEADSPRGRLYLMKALAERRLEPGAGAVRHLDLCLGCRACETACPSGVQYGRVLESARAWLDGGDRAPVHGDAEVGVPRFGAGRPVDSAAQAAGGTPATDSARAAGHRRGFRDRLLRQFLVGRVLSDAGGARVAVRLLRMAERLHLLGFAAPLLPPGFDAARWARALAPAPGIDWSRTPGVRREGLARGSRQVVVPGTPPVRGRVAFLTGCVMDGLFGRTNDATLRVLTREGWDVVLPGRSVCCGALAAHAGLSTRAGRLHSEMTEAYADAGADALVVNAAGCGAHLKDTGAPGLPVLDITEFLDRNGFRSPLGAPRLAGRPPSGAGQLTVTYQDACHLAHAQKLTAPPRRLLATLPGVTVVPLAEGDLCCGSAGSYNILEPDMAGRLGRRKAAQVVASGAEVLVSANMGCLTQIRSHLGGDQVAIHIIELIDLAMSSGARVD
jgi:glycolate oxidase iron-sulfur subunit